MQTERTRSLYLESVEAISFSRFAIELAPRRKVLLPSHEWHASALKLDIGKPILIRVWQQLFNCVIKHLLIRRDSFFCEENLAWLSYITANKGHGSEQCYLVFQMDAQLHLSHPGEFMTTPSCLANVYCLACPESQIQYVLPTGRPSSINDGLPSLGKKPYPYM